MRLNRDLNLVVTIDRDDGSAVHVHATPISYEVYKQYFMVLSQTFAALFSSGMREIAGPSACALMLEEFVRQRAGQGPDSDSAFQAAGDKAWAAVNLGLLGEITRLANVIYLTPQGWITEPLESAVKREVLTEDERRELDGQLLFFTLMVRVGSRKVGMAMQGLANRLWGSDLIASTCTEFANSLLTLTDKLNTEPPAGDGKMAAGAQVAKQLPVPA